MTTASQEGRPLKNGRPFNLLYRVFFHWRPILCRRLLVVLILILSGLRPGWGQPLYIAPAETTADRIRFLVLPPESRPLEIEFHAFAVGDTNVMPLFAGANRSAARQTFNGSHAYFDGYRSYEAAISGGMWRISYASTTADLYQGNRDAAQLYLDSLSNSINPYASMQPQVSMNRTAAIRWRVAYATPIRLVSHYDTLLMAANFLQMQRVQLGNLSGATTGNSFTGNLSILSTLGLPPGETRGYGLSLDMGLALDFGKRWRVEVSVDNLISQVWERHLQEINADVTTNTIQPDANGFLHDVPLLQGSVSSTSLADEIRRQYNAGLAFRQGAQNWLLMVRRDVFWQAGAGFAMRSGREGLWWGLAWLQPFEWQTGFDLGNWQIQFGMSSFVPSSARRATINLLWRIPISRAR